MTVVRHLSTDQDTTRKTLWRLFDGTLVESVLMRYPDRVTMCISSQAGCGMNCPFCATGQAGLDRNLSTGEIVHQIVDGMRALRDGEIPGGPARLSNIVFMGMGEPLANYKRVVGAIRALTDPEPDGLGLSQRGITVSTVGLVPAIHRFSDEGFKCRLAISLHAPDDERPSPGAVCPSSTPSSGTSTTRHGVVTGSGGCSGASPCTSTSSR
jgi:23S rRNA (adenine2503-C2)-methyltransferase